MFWIDEQLLEHFDGACARRHTNRSERLRQLVVKDINDELIEAIRLRQEMIEVTP